MAKGSEMSLAGYKHVKACAGCGEKLTLSGLRPLWFVTDAAGARGFHFECFPREERA